MEYQHGGDIYTNQVSMDYSANINPLGLPKGVKRTLIQAVDGCSHYPDSRSEALKQGLAEFHQVKEEFFICGNGAADLIFQVVQAVRPEEALLIAPSFLEYEQALKTVSSHITWFDLKEEDGFRLSVKALQTWIKSSGRTFQMIFLCNPNNPTGLALKKEEVAELLDFCREKGIFCVIDECFNEFLQHPEEYSVIDTIKSGGYDHVFLLKAFTKIYAMAGLRLGYGICSNQKILKKMEEIRQPWSVSSLAQAAGAAALLETAYVEKTRQLIEEERNYLKEKLLELGFYVFDSMANYLFFKDLRPEAEEKEKLLYQQLLNHGVLIRSCGNYRGLNGTFYRICIKGRKENEAFVSILNTVLTKGE